MIGLRKWNFFILKQILTKHYQKYIRLLNCLISNLRPTIFFISLKDQCRIITKRREDYSPEDHKYFKTKLNYFFTEKITKLKRIIIKV
jgi:hypothetical protein